LENERYEKTPRLTLRIEKSIEKIGGKLSSFLEFSQLLAGR
jgi:hypothetical protein